MASRKIEDLHPALQDTARQFLQEAQLAGIDALITCTYRSWDEQADLYAQGRTKPGKIVTNAKPGHSKHNYRLPDGTPASEAFDVVPVRGGKAIWNAEDPAWQELGRIGEALGLEWAGRWKRMREYPHFQLPE